jgi:biotin carboxyl carrier protein
MEELKIIVDGKEYDVQVEETEEGKLKVSFEGEVFEVEQKADIEEEIQGKASGAESGIIKAPLPGTIFLINVKEGDHVKKGQKLITLIAMKMENEISATKEGKIKEVKVKQNDTVNTGDVLIVIE